MIDSTPKDAEKDTNDQGVPNVDKANLDSTIAQTPQFTVEQLMNTDLLLSGALFESDNKQKQALLKGTLTDFTLSSLNSIVPLMNLTELFLLSPATAVSFI